MARKSPEDPPRQRVCESRDILQVCRKSSLNLLSAKNCPVILPVKTAKVGGNMVVVTSFPKCQKCELGDLVPLSDFGSQGAAIYFKAWACTNPSCGFNIKIRNGDLYIDEPITSGAMHTPRLRA